MTEAEETLARIRIYLTNRIALAREAAATAPDDSPQKHWGTNTNEELSTVLLMIDEGVSGY